MSSISLKGAGFGATLVSNRFIEDHMTDANEAQIKVYLYLLCAMGNHLPVSVSLLADRFNYTEKDVLRSLFYWERKGLLTITRDEGQNLVGICVNEAIAPAISPEEHAASVSPVDSRMPVSSAEHAASGSPAESCTSDSVSGHTDNGSAADHSADAAPTVPFYTQEQVSSFRDKEEIRQLLFSTELYMGRPLTRSDMNSLMFMYDGLHFSSDMIEYLVEYCISSGHRSMRYIETVGRSWAERGITTPEEARRAGTSDRYYKECYAVLKEFGISGRGPVPADVEYIEKWMNSYGASEELILEACRRTVKATAKPSFSYADSILKNWNEKGVRALSDLASLDEDHRKRSAAAAGTADRPAAPNRFRNFSERNDDFDSIARELLQ